MWKPVVFAMAVGMLAGCIAIEVNETPDHARLPPGGAMSCAPATYQYLVGQNEADIDRDHLPSAFRIICAGCMATRDFNPNRLNIQLGPDQRVASVSCG